MSEPNCLTWLHKASKPEGGFSTGFSDTDSLGALGGEAVVSHIASNDEAFVVGKVSVVVGDAAVVFQSSSKDDI
jgi:hypothetical protein